MPEVAGAFESSKNFSTIGQVMNLLRKTPGVLDALNCLSKREGVGQHLGPRGVSIFGTARLDNERSRNVGRPGGKVNRITKSPACDQRSELVGAHRI